MYNFYNIKQAYCLFVKLYINFSKFTLFIYKHIKKHPSYFSIYFMQTSQNLNTISLLRSWQTQFPLSTGKSLSTRTKSNWAVPKDVFINFKLKQHNLWQSLAYTRNFPTLPRVSSIIRSHAINGPLNVNINSRDLLIHSHLLGRSNVRLHDFQTSFDQCNWKIERWETQKFKLLCCVWAKCLSQHL